MARLERTRQRGRLRQGVLGARIAPRPSHVLTGWRCDDLQLYHESGVLLCTTRHMDAGYELDSLRTVQSHGASTTRLDASAGLAPLPSIHISNQPEWIAVD